MYTQDDVNKFLSDFMEKNDIGSLSFKEYDGEKNWFCEGEIYTPLGEDWIIDIWFDGTAKDFSHALFGAYDDFDVDEEASRWITVRGENGVPNSVEDLLDDAKWKKHFLNKLWGESRKFLDRFELLMTPLKDDSTEHGGIAHEGERLYEFLDETDTSYDASLKDINEALKACGIKPVKEKDDVER